MCGVPIMKDGHGLGAVGVSGVSSQEDAQISVAGMAGLGLWWQAGADYAYLVRISLPSLVA